MLKMLSTTYRFYGEAERGGFMKNCVISSGWHQFWIIFALDMEIASGV